MSVMLMSKDPGAIWSWAVGKSPGKEQSGTAGWLCIPDIRDTEVPEDGFQLPAQGQPSSRLFGFRSDCVFLFLCVALTNSFCLLVLLFP